MLLRVLSASCSNLVEPAYEAFLKTQVQSEPTYGLLFQSEHSRVAGALAQALRPQVFGQLNPDVIAAIAHHDYGWEANDKAQLEMLSRQPPHSFTKLSAEETLPSWVASIDHGRKLGPLAAVLISRHCCLLGTGSGKHAGFLAHEAEERTQIERTLAHSPEEIDRWTGALGFCDLLSLYLCSGSQTSVRLALAHPAAGSCDRQVTLDWVNHCPRLSEPLLNPDAEFFASGYKYAGAGSGVEPLSLHWTVAHSNGQA